MEEQLQWDGFSHLAARPSLHSIAIFQCCCCCWGCFFVLAVGDGDGCPVYRCHSLSMFAVYVFSACTKWSVDDMMVLYVICELRIAHGFTRVFTFIHYSVGVIWFDKNTTAAA